MLLVKHLNQSLMFKSVVEVVNGMSVSRAGLIYLFRHVIMLILKIMVNKFGAAG